MFETSVFPPIPFHDQQMNKENIYIDYVVEFQL